jgi:hypothetical protein
MLPNFFIIGGIKCASTSLHAYVSHHPDIAMSSPKELHYFESPDWRDRREWYESHFTTPAPIRGESTTHYSWYPHKPGVPKRIHSVVPDAKFVYLVRDPVDRILAHWVWNYTNGDREDWAEWMTTVEDPSNKLVAASRYALQVEQYLEYFPMSSMLVLDYRGLRDQRRETLREVFEFLGVDPNFETEAWDEQHNVRRERTLTPFGKKVWYRLGPRTERLPAMVAKPITAAVQATMSTDVISPPVSDEDREILADVLRPDAERLRELTGKPFAGWSV